METLIFRLYAPIAAFSAPAVGEDRASVDAPTAGMVLGLLAAALGIRRSEEAKQLALRDDLRYAVKTISSGSLMSDYHTIQMPSTRKGIIHRTRKSELAGNHLNTLLSSRDYRCDGLWVVAVRLLGHSTYTLSQLEQSLKTPSFVLYLGRKSCPLAAPLAPRIVEASDWQTALDSEFLPIAKSNQQQDYLLATSRDWSTQQRRVSYQWSGDLSEMNANISASDIATYHKHDEPLSRQRWQFRERQIHRWDTQEAL